MSLRFWRRSPLRSYSSASLNTADNSAIAGVSPPPDLDRKASRYSLLETIAACSVVAGIVIEDWDAFGKFIHRPDWVEGRMAIGGAIVALGIVLEILFSSRVSSAERKIRDWYAVKVAELNLKAETEYHARLRLEKTVSDRDITAEDFNRITARLFEFRGQHVHIVPAKNLLEVKHVIRSIEQTLTHSGWIVNTESDRPIPHEVQSQSLYVIGTRDQETQDALRALQSALDEIGHTAARINEVPMWVSFNLKTQQPDQKAIAIIVNEKPMPLFADL